MCTHSTGSSTTAQQNSDIYFLVMYKYVMLYFCIRMTLYLAFHWFIAMPMSKVHYSKMCLANFIKIY